MASYALDEFLGPGALKDMGPKFAEDGWDNVPTLKVIGAEDVEALNLTHAQRDALELRIYLHNRSLMKYADRMEASRLELVRLVTMKPGDLVSKFKMRKTHVAAFLDTAMGCDIQMPPDLPRVLSARRRSPLANPMRYMKLPKPKPVLKPPPFELHKSTLSEGLSGNSPPRRSNVGEKLGHLRNFYARGSPRRKSNAGELTSSRVGPAKFSPPRRSSAGEFGSRNNYARISSPRKSSAGESLFNGWNSPPRMSNVSETGWNSPPRKSSAGEFATFRNGLTKICPARMSSAGELGSRNCLARMSPPRKSSAGESGFSGWNSPPRKSNVGELGFNGNPFPREVPARKPSKGDFTFTGNPFHRASSPPRRSCGGPWGFHQPLFVRPSEASSRRGNVASKGMFAPVSNKRQLCGMVKAPSSDKVAKLSTLEKVSLRRLAPEHSYGVGSATLKGSRKLEPFPASSLWADKATLFFCIRRPGCVMCRAEAHQLFARKPIFDALGVQLVAVVLEDIDEEVWAFWPRYWAGMVVLDEKRDFFKALGGGKLMKDSLLTGFFLNPIARLNWKRAVKTGIKYNTRGEGTIKGGTFIVRPGKGGVAYQFAEKNFGDWAPLDEVLQVCHAIREEGDSDGW